MWNTELHNPGEVRTHESIVIPSVYTITQETFTICSACESVRRDLGPKMAESKKLGSFLTHSSIMI